MLAVILPWGIRARLLLYRFGTPEAVSRDVFGCTYLRGPIAVPWYATGRQRNSCSWMPKSTLSSALGSAVATRIRMAGAEFTRMLHVRSLRLLHAASAST